MKYMGTHNCRILDTELPIDTDDKKEQMIPITKYAHSGSAALYLYSRVIGTHAELPRQLDVIEKLEKKRKRKRENKKKEEEE